MTRDWYAVYRRLFRTPKFRRLSNSAQLALFYVWALAGDTETESIWPNAAELGDMLQLDGQPRGAVDDLLAAGWLDALEDGRIAVHDWDDHQLAVTADVRKKWERDRKREWRRGRVPPAPPSGKTGESQDTTGVPRTSGTSPGHVGDGETREPVDEDLPDGLGAYFRLTARVPRDQALIWLQRLIDEHGDEGVLVALAQEWRLNPDLSTFLGRTETRLKRAGMDREHEHREHEQEAWLAEQQRLEAAMAPEERAANLARLRAEMERLGLRSAFTTGDTREAMKRGPCPGRPRPRRATGETDPR